MEIASFETKLGWITVKKGAVVFSHLVLVKQIKQKILKI